MTTDTTSTEDTDTDPRRISDAHAVIDAVKSLHEPTFRTTTVDGREAVFAVVPNGMRVQSIKPLLDEYRTKPERRRGIARVTELASFIEHVNRFKDDDSAIFADDSREAPSLTAVLDYHEKADGEPRFGDHRTLYQIPFAEEWKLWQAQNKQAMDQRDFAAFLEDRVADVLAPPPSLQGLIKERDAGGDFGDKTPDEILADYAKTVGHEIAGPSRLIELSRGLSVRVDEQVQNATVLQTGEVAIQYTAEHTDADQKPLKVPGLFLIGIPVFRGGAHYRVAVRLRYRTRAGAITWFFELYRDDAVLDHAFHEVCEKAKEETDLPLIVGTPEG